MSSGFPGIDVCELGRGFFIPSKITYEIDIKSGSREYINTWEPSFGLNHIFTHSRILRLTEGFGYNIKHTYLDENGIKESVYNGGTTVEISYIESGVITDSTSVYYGLKVEKELHKDLIKVTQVESDMLKEIFTFNINPDSEFAKMYIRKLINKKVFSNPKKDTYKFYKHFPGFEKIWETRLVKTTLSELKYAFK